MIISANQWIKKLVLSLIVVKKKAANLKIKRKKAKIKNMLGYLWNLYLDRLYINYWLKG